MNESMNHVSPHRWQQLNEQTRTWSGKEQEGNRGQQSLMEVICHVRLTTDVAVPLCLVTSRLVLLSFGLLCLSLVIYLVKNESPVAIGHLRGKKVSTFKDLFTLTPPGSEPFVQCSSVCNLRLTLRLKIS